MDGLKLELQVAKPEVVRGESIRFMLTLTNMGNAPVELADESATNRAFSVHVKGVWGFEGRGDQMSLQEREGEHVDEPRVRPRKKLEPGKSLIARGDVIPWIGEIEPGSYSLTGHYLDTLQYRAQSAPVEIKVVEAAPVYARSVGLNAPLAHAARDTAWLHRSAGGFNLFLLRSSPRHPPVAYANFPLAKLPARASVWVSSYNSFPPMTQHAVWTLSDEKLWVVAFRGDIPLEAPFAISLPSEDLEPVATPYSDERGNLHVLLATPDGDAASLLQLLGKQAPVFIPVKLGPPLVSPRSALWCKDEALALAWVGGEENEVYGAVARLSEPPRPIVPKKVFASEQPIVGLTLFQRPGPGGDNYERMMLVLSHDEANDIFQRWQIDVESGSAKEEGRFVADGAGNYRLMEAALQDDFIPHYLFAGPNGAVFYSDASFSGFAPVFNQMHKPVKTTDFPSLVSSTKFSKLPGKYVRYIEGGRQFAYAKLK